MSGHGHLILCSFLFWPACGAYFSLLLFIWQLSSPYLFYIELFDFRRVYTPKLRSLIVNMYNKALIAALSGLALTSAQTSPTNPAIPSSTAEVPTIEGALTYDGPPVIGFTG